MTVKDFVDEEFDKHKDWSMDFGDVIDRRDLHKIVNNTLHHFNVEIKRKMT